MNTEAAHEAEARFCALCRSYQVPAVAVLQAFASGLSVHGYLLAVAPCAAAEVFSFFVRSCPPSLPLHPEKRRRGIRNIRRILKTAQSLRDEEAKEKVYRDIEEAWAWANELPGEETAFRLGQGLFLPLPKPLLLLCDVFRCQPRHLLYYFMELLATEAEAFDTEGPAFRLLVHCCGQHHPACNN